MSIGPRAEAEFGRRFFLDLTSTFTGETNLRVVWGRTILGFVPPLTIVARPEHGPQVILLGGRAWQVEHVDWRRRQVRVEPTAHRGRSRWNGGGQAMSYALARAHLDVLAGKTASVTVSRRAADALDELRAKYSFASDEPGDRTYLVHTSEKRPTWWTFAGFAANSALAAGLDDLVAGDGNVGDLRLRLRPNVTSLELAEAIRSRYDAILSARPNIDDEAVEGLKFAAALPRHLAVDTLATRLVDVPAVRAVLRSLVREETSTQAE